MDSSSFVQALNPQLVRIVLTTPQGFQTNSKKKVKPLGNSRLIWAKFYSGGGAGSQMLSDNRGINLRLRSQRQPVS